MAPAKTLSGEFILSLLSTVSCKNKQDKTNKTKIKEQNNYKINRIDCVGKINRIKQIFKNLLGNQIDYKQINLNILFL
jgi:hypothetical protein